MHNPGYAHWSLRAPEMLALILQVSLNNASYLGKTFPLLRICLRFIVSTYIEGQPLQTTE